MLRSRVTEWTTIGLVELVVGLAVGFAGGSLWWLATAAFFGLWMYALSCQGSILASIATGNGAALLLGSAKLRRWERTHGGHVVTASRRRWWTSVDVYVLR